MKFEYLITRSDILIRYVPEMLNKTRTRILKYLQIFILKVKIIL